MIEEYSASPRAPDALMVIASSQVETNYLDSAQQTLQRIVDEYPDSKAAETARSRRYRSEEHTSELQSRGHLVCRLLLEKKKNKKREHGSASNNKTVNDVRKQESRCGVYD